MDNVKVFTPDNVVDLMLEFVSYSTSKYILKKHVMDNSCGNGAILKEVVYRYIVAYLKKDLKDPERELNEEEKKELREELSTYIHGIEIDEELHRQCINKLNKVTNGFGFDGVEWDIVCGDTLTINKYDGNMDFVIGNPPYQKVHDFGDKKDFYKSFNFIDKGMADLYIIFFEIGFNMLKCNGRMVYITPSSWTTSIAGTKLREYIIENNLLETVIDYKNIQVFDNVTTFTMISVFDKSRRRSMYFKGVWVFDYEAREGDTRPIDDWVIDGKLYFNVDRKCFKILKKIKDGNYETYVKVKNGYATLKDKLFIIEEEDYNEDLNPTKNCSINKCIKASKAEEKFIVYPYKISGEPVPFEKLWPKTQELLLERATKLGVDITKNGWWLYGRTQGLKDTYKHKLSVNNLIKTVEDLKVCFANWGYGVYSGFYVVQEKEGPGGFGQPYYEAALNVFREILTKKDDNEFINYVKALGKYKSGGYYTFSSKELQDYLNYKIEEVYGEGKDTEK